MKRTILLPVFSLVMLQLAAQTKTVNIHGTVKDTSLKSVEISHLVDDKLSKWENTEVNVENGTFNTSIQIPFPLEINIAYRNRVFGKKFIYTDAEILIDSVGEPHMIGSPVQDEYENEFLPFFQSNDLLFDSIQLFFQRNRQLYGKDIPKQVQDSANFLKERYGSQRAALLSKYIKGHPNSYIALWNIYYFFSMGILNQYFDFEKLLSSFSDQVQQHSFIHALKEKIKESGKMQVGQLFPKEFFKGNEAVQRKVGESSQYYLIDLWYSHCPPCIAGFPKLKAIYNQFHGKGFDIISISVDKQKDEKDYAAAIKKYGLSWNHVWDKDGITAQKFNINTFPTFILLDKDGRILNPAIQDPQLEAFLKEHLSKL